MEIIKRSKPSLQEHVVKARATSLEIRKKNERLKQKELQEIARSKKASEAVAVKKPDYSILLNHKLNSYKTTHGIANKPFFSGNDYPHLQREAFEQIWQVHEPENKKWILDSGNEIQTALLFFWFGNDKKSFDKIVTDNNLENFSFNKSFYLLGERGSGKSSTVFALNEMVKLLVNPKLGILRNFKFIEQNKMANTYRLENHINKYTFNEAVGKFASNPYHLVLDDLKVDETLSFGTRFLEILIQFLYDRHSIWQFSKKQTIITGLMPPNELEKLFPKDLYDRFLKQYNLLVFSGNRRV